MAQIQSTFEMIDCASAAAELGCTLSRQILSCVHNVFVRKAMSNVVNAENLEIRAHWKRIAIKDKLIGNPSLSDLLLSGTYSVDKPYYLLYNNQPYCFFEGSMYQMLLVEDPSIGYKLVDSTVDRKTVLSSATGITETEAIDAMFLLMK